MTEIAQETCVPCKGGVRTLTEAEISKLQPQVPEWQVLDVNGVKRLRREFKFPDFRQALDFTCKVGEIAEREQHHPDIHLGYGKTMVEVWTHAIRGLHRNDFIVAAKIDELNGG
jgi:4a-hydroxytetrahydrobiopterin dehydratase